ncbi:unnamed protein product [Prorocentrum cordatum]|uniref:Uncharacterized protein n=1 Tax=Prorocentrum cordatum TaxID=2364126 RepID=A0ABN9XA23_9DINO|nr:unnamed protein product [Polarella glacialis]
MVLTCLFTSRTATSTPPLLWRSPGGDSLGKNSTVGAATATAVFNATIAASPSLWKISLRLPRCRMKLIKILTMKFVTFLPGTADEHGGLVLESLATSIGKLSSWWELELVQLRYHLQLLLSNDGLRPEHDSSCSHPNSL